jgi:galactosyl transferase GMA12/MNN10 family
MGPLLDFSGRTFRWYAERHGYDFIIGSGDARGRPPAWAKVPLLRRLLDSYEKVVWIDADAVILQIDLDIAEQLQPDDYQALVLNHRDEESIHPNTGVWVLRGDRAKRFLDAVWAETTFIDHHLWEQAAAMRLLGYPLQPGLAIEESRWTPGTRWLDDDWNNGSGATPARIRHYAGQENKYRLRRMQIDLATTDETLKGPVKVMIATARLIASRERRRPS